MSAADAPVPVPVRAFAPVGGAAMKRLLVHIGTRKIGCTSIQKTLAVRDAELRANGVYVPWEGNIPHNGLHISAWRTPSTLSDR